MEVGQAHQHHARSLVHLRPAHPGDPYSLACNNTDILIHYIYRNPGLAVEVGQAHPLHVRSLVHLRLARELR